LSRLADEHDPTDFRDPGSAAHQQLVEIVERLAVVQKPKLERLFPPSPKTSPSRKA
jgi:hypothetical protein